LRQDPFGDLTPHLAESHLSKHGATEVQPAYTPLKTKTNPRLMILRVFALLGILPGLGLVLMGIATGLRGGGLLWLVAAALTAFGLAWAWKAVSYFKNPSPRAARDLVTLFSVVVFSVLFSTIKRRYPEVWGIPESLGIARENAMGVTTFIALTIAWAAHRLLKTYVIEPAFVPSKEESAG
jgi:hypothetical protein